MFKGNFAGPCLLLRRVKIPRLTCDSEEKDADNDDDENRVRRVTNRRHFATWNQHGTTWFCSSTLVTDSNLVLVRPGERLRLSDLNLTAIQIHFSQRILQFFLVRNQSGDPTCLSCHLH